MFYACLGTMALIVLLWFGISAPLSAIGSYFGSKHGVCDPALLLIHITNSPTQAVTHPVRVNPIPRQIPPVPWYLRPWVRQTLGKMHLLRINDHYRHLHYSREFFRLVSEHALDSTDSILIIFTGAAFVELYFVMSSLFASRAYYAFGFLALTAGIVALTTATVSILFTYLLLCAEEYRFGSLPSLYVIRTHWISQMALACIPNRGWKCLLGASLWALLLGISSLAWLLPKCLSLSGLPLPSRSI